jgi:hypothetical protein
MPNSPLRCNSTWWSWSRRIRHRTMGTGRAAKWAALPIVLLYQIALQRMSLLWATTSCTSKRCMPCCRILRRVYLCCFIHLLSLEVS